MNHNLQRVSQTISFWSKFMGYVMIVTGALEMIFGLFPWVVPALLGLFFVILGVYMVKAGRKAEEFNRYPSDESLQKMLEYLAKSFKLQGIYMVICFVLAIILSLLFIFIGISSLIPFIGLQ